MPSLQEIYQELQLRGIKVVYCPATSLYVETILFSEENLGIADSWRYGPAFATWLKPYSIDKYLEIRKTDSETRFKASSFNLDEISEIKNSDVKLFILQNLDLIHDP